MARGPLGEPRPWAAGQQKRPGTWAQLWNRGPRPRRKCQTIAPRRPLSPSRPYLRFRRRGEFLCRKRYLRAGLRGSGPAGAGRGRQEEGTGRRPALTPGHPRRRAATSPASEDLEPGGRRHDTRVRNMRLSCPFAGRVTWSPGATGPPPCTGTTRRRRALCGARPGLPMPPPRRPAESGQR